MHIQCTTKVSTPLIFLQIFKYISSQISASSATSSWRSGRAFQWLPA